MASSARGELFCSMVSTPLILVFVLIAIALVAARWRTGRRVPRRFQPRWRDKRDRGRPRWRS